MANMSYCRFQNTNLDLRDCLENMDDNELSYDENVARWTLIKKCVQIAADYGDEADLPKPKRDEG